MKQTVQEAAKEAIHKNYNCNGVYPCSEREYCEHCGGCNTAFDCNECGADDYKEGFIAGAEWQAKQSPWISVEDKLPEENTGVLFLVEWGKNHYGYFVGVYYGNGCWESDHRVFLPDSNIGKVTHWMLIPALPKGGEE